MKSFYLNQNELLKYIKKPLSKKEINDIFDKYGIIIEKCDLYIDFIETFSNKVYKTYLGSDYLNTQDKIDGHLKWCFNETIQEFLQYGFCFHFDDDLFEYFKEFFFLVYYSIPDEDKEEVIKDGVQYWQRVFNYNGIKSQSDLDDFMDLYWLFNCSIDPSLKEEESEKTSKIIN